MSDVQQRKLAPISKRPRRASLVSRLQRATQESNRQTRRNALHLSPKESVFLYRAWRDKNRPIEGERSAADRTQVEEYLRHRGYTQFRVMQKWLPLRSRPPTEEVVLFVRLCADLLREKIPLDEAVELLQSEVKHPRLRGALEEIVHDLREGKSGNEVFGKHPDVLGRFPAQMFAIASTSDNLPEVFESAAKFIERKQAFRKSIKSALLMPTITLVVLFGAVVFYVGYIFPEFATMYERFDIPLPPMTNATLALSRFIGDYLLLFLVLGAIGVIGSGRFFLTAKGRLTRDRWLLRLPVLGPLFEKASIEIWCRMFHALYRGAAGNIEAIRIASEACQNRYLEERIKSRSIPLIEKHGLGFVEALEKSGVFNQNVLARFRAGEASGTLKKSSLQIAKYYEKDSTYRMRAVLDWIQVSVAILITIVMTALTIISSETAVIQPNMPGVNETTTMSAR